MNNTNFLELIKKSKQNKTQTTHQKLYLLAHGEKSLSKRKVSTETSLEKAITFYNECIQKGWYCDIFTLDTEITHTINKFKS